MDKLLKNIDNLLMKYAKYFLYLSSFSALCFVSAFFVPYYEYPRLFPLLSIGGTFSSLFWFTLFCIFSGKSYQPYRQTIDVRVSVDELPTSKVEHTHNHYHHNFNYTSVTEGTERVEDMPDGRIITTRKIKRWG